MVGQSLPKFIIIIANHFESIFNASCPTVTPYSVTTDFLPMAPISAAKFSRNLKRLEPSKCDGLDGIPSFIIKGSDNFMPLLTYIFNLRQQVRTFHPCGNILLLFQHSRLWLATIDISTLNSSYKLFRFVIYDHLYCLLAQT
jgi:hypothetical protein